MSALSSPSPGAQAGDFYDIASTLDARDQELVARVRACAREHVAPIITTYWRRAEFPFELVPRLAALGIGGLGYRGYGCAGRSSTVAGFVMMELATVDPSIATFVGVHCGLAMGAIYACGSEEQKQRWLPSMASFAKIGAFGLTEPDVGSGAARGLTTTARRERDSWVLNGRKKWIGNATFADWTIIWARDEVDRQVKGFVVERGTPGFTAKKMEDKMALRVVQNALITLSDCLVPDANRLDKARSFRDTAEVLKRTRVSVAWEAVGCARGAYQHAAQYALERRQFGRPIGSFQLVQDLLARMLANITASQCLCLRLSQLEDEGRLTDEHASLAKAFCTMKMRETVGWARELLGGNGILLEHNVGRFVADAEAIYSYEGTREMNALIVGRSITGLGAFI
ncbi:MAG TPA: acyl-CoA dehydrogenase family protein [Haliangiales bacterium]|nr:acyl-CoA dehydrogenase family protein [Haliangiales bacterium]